MERMLTCVGTPSEASTCVRAAFQGHCWAESYAQKKPRRICSAYVTGTVGSSTNLGGTVTALGSSVTALGSSVTALGSSVTWGDMGVWFHSSGDATCILIVPTAMQQVMQQPSRLERMLGPSARLLDIGPAGSLPFRRSGWFALRDRDEIAASVMTPLLVIHREAPDSVQMDYGVESTRFLSQLYKMARDGNERPVIRFVYAHMYRLRMAEDFAIIDRILEDIDVQRLPPSLLVAILTITVPIKKNLDNRASFYDRSKSTIEAVRGPQATSRILAGLE